MQIKFVYFDIGGVAFNFRVALTALAEKTHQPLASIERVFKTYDEQVCRGDMSPQQLWEHMQKKLSIDDTIENFLEWWTSHFIPNKDVHQFMRTVGKKYRIGIITNIFEGALSKMFEKKQVPQLHYDAIIASCDLHLTKTDDAFFQYAQQAAKVNPEEIFYIDDSPKHIDKANLLGWNTYLFNPQEIPESIAAIKPLLRIV